MYKTIIAICLATVLIGIWYVSGEVYREQAQNTPSVTFEIEAGESVRSVAKKLEEKQIIRSEFWFRQYLRWKKLDREVRAGIFTVTEPITIARIADSLQNPAQNETEITIIPGWTLRDIAAYFVSLDIVENEQEVFAYTGIPTTIDGTIDLSFISPVPQIVEDIPEGISIEGYIRPDTYRIFTDSTIQNILKKLILARTAEFTDQMRADIAASNRSIHEILTVASLIEKEVRTADDLAIVSDIFWKRYDAGWAMQADSTVHYIDGSSGDVFTTPAMRNSLNSYNTYKYPGLPPGPISTPNIDAILAAIYPEDSPYWYFLTTLDTGEVKFARTLDEHNANVQKYLR